MTEVRTQIPATDLTPGQFFLISDRWYRALSAVKRVADNAPQIKVTSPVNGGHHWIWLYPERVTVTEGNTVPATFRPTALRRKAEAARKQAAELTQVANQLDILTIEMQHEINQPATRA